MQFEFSPRFKKQFVKTPKKVRAQTSERLALLLGDEFHPLLNNHKLHGSYTGYRSINVTGDWRIVYRKTDNDTFYLYDIGTHSELYS